MYRRSPSSQEYILVNSNKIEIDIYRRKDRGGWKILNYREGDRIDLPCINLTFAIEDIFESIVFEEEERS